MKILDELDRLEREATAGPWNNTKSEVYYEGCVTIAVSRAGTDPKFREQDAKLIAYSRNHLRALIEIARAADKYIKTIYSSDREEITVEDINRSEEKLLESLAKLEPAEGDGD